MSRMPSDGDRPVVPVEAPPSSIRGKALPCSRSVLSCNRTASPRHLVVLLVVCCIVVSIWYSDSATRRLRTSDGSTSLQVANERATMEARGTDDDPLERFGERPMPLRSTLEQWIAAAQLTRSDMVPIRSTVCAGWADATWKDVLQAELVLPVDRGPWLADRIPNASVLYLQNETAGRRFPFPRLSPDERRFKDGQYRLYAYWSNGWVRQYGWNFDETQYHFPERFFVASVPNVHLFPDETVLFCGAPSIKHHLSTCMRDAFFIGLAQQRGRLSQRLFPKRQHHDSGVVTRLPNLNVTSNAYAASSPPSAPNVVVVPIGIPLCATVDCTLAGPYHIVVEQLTRLAPLVDVLTTSRSVDVRVVVTMSVRSRPILVEYFALMGIPLDRVLEAPHGAVIQQALYTPTLCYRPSLFGLHALRRVVLRRLEGLDSDGSSRSEPSPWSSPTSVSKEVDRVRTQRPLYVVFSERLDASRRPLNYASLKTLLLRLFARSTSSNVCFRYITVTNISDPTTIRAFALADLVVGVHGANLVPMLFAKRGSVLVEMLAKVHSACYYYLSSMVGARYAPVFYYGNYSARRWIPVQEVVAQVGDALGFPEWATADDTFDLFFEEVLHRGGAGSSVTLMSMGSNTYWGCSESERGARFERTRPKGDPPTFRVAQLINADGVRRLLMYRTGLRRPVDVLKQTGPSAVAQLGAATPMCLGPAKGVGKDQPSKKAPSVLCGCEQERHRTQEEHIAERRDANRTVNAKGIRFQRLGIVRYSAAVFLVTDDGNGCVASDGTVHPSRPCNAGDAWLLSGPDLS